MSFDSWADFWAMGGHGLYIWLCYSVGLVGFVLMAVTPVMQRKKLLRDLLQQKRRKQMTGSNAGSRTAQFSVATENQLASGQGEAKEELDKS